MQWCKVCSVLGCSPYMASRYVGTVVNVLVVKSCNIQVVVGAYIERFFVVNEWCYAHVCLYAVFNSFCKSVYVCFKFVFVEKWCLPLLAQKARVLAIY